MVRSDLIGTPKQAVDASFGVLCHVLALKNSYKRVSQGKEFNCMTIQPNMLPDLTFRESYDLKQKQLKQFYSKLWAGIPKWVPQLVASSWLVTLHLWD